MNGTRATDYVDSFNEMRSFIDQSLDEFKGELKRVVFPLFVCLFLNMMLRKEFQKEAIAFFESVKNDFENQHRTEITLLETVHDVSRLADPEVAKFLKNKFFVKMSRQAYTIFKFQIDFNQLNLILHIVNLNIQFEITSEQDIILDRKSGSQAIMVEPEQEVLKPQLILNRLKEFNPDAWEITTGTAEE